MLTITADQMNALKSGALAPLRAKYVRILRRRLPAFTQGRSDSELDAFCERGIAAAREHGIDTEYNVYVFVAASLVLGDDFQQGRSGAQEFLGDDRIHQDIKAALLEFRVLIDTGVEIAPHERRLFR